MPTSPIEAVLPRLVEELGRARAVVLTAPPGAGKSTRAPLAILSAGLGGSGQIVMLQPRRLAARVVARRMACLLDQQVGQTVGYRVRFEDVSSPETRILVVTEGILTGRFLTDPLLEGVSCVILDEFHERSVHLDLALAFLRELMEVRDDLMLVIMSATLQVDPVRQFIGDCPHVDCQAREHPLTIHHLPVVDRRPLPQRVRTGLLQLMQREDDDGGDLLVFLPGAPEIRRTLEHLERTPLPGAPALVPLYGALSSKEQDVALESGRGRRVVLATNIAETSLTVPGITAVVDSGLVKRQRYDARTGMDRLELGRISKSSAAQRSGRAGRMAPGRVLRLWTAAEQAGLAEADQPEIQRLDLSPVLLSVMSFHPGPPAAFAFFEKPSQGALSSALELLRMLGALDPSGDRLNELGQRLCQLPLHPRQGVLLEAARRRGLLADGVLLAALLGERDVLQRSSDRPASLPTSDSDLLYRRDLFLELERQRFSPGAAEQLGLNLRAALDVRQARNQLERVIQHRWGAQLERRAGSDGELLELVLAGYPDRVCRRRRRGKPEAVMVGGRGVKLAEESGVRDADLFVALVADAGPRGSHAISLVRMASAVDERALEAVFPDQLRIIEETIFDEPRGLVKGVRRKLMGDLMLTEKEGLVVDEQRAAVLLSEAAEARFEQLFCPDKRTEQLIARLRVAAQHLSEEDWPDASESGLRRLLPDLCQGCRSLEQLSEMDWGGALADALTFQQRRLLDRELPEQVAVPSGRSIAIDYTAALAPGGAPVLAVKLQEVFGLTETPRVARDQVALRLHLLAPSGRPVQVTQDLKSFWKEGYAQVRKDLRGRYPKHPWPEDPWTARPTAGTKRRPKRRPGR